VEDELFVVKVQSSLFSSDGDNHYLVYPEDRSFDLMVSQSDFPQLREPMKNRVKRYFWARIDDKQQCEILVRLPCDQDQDF